MISKRLWMLSFIIIPICIFVLCPGKASAAVSGDHIYVPIALEDGKRSGNFCADPAHPEDPSCQLFSFAFKTASPEAAETDAGVKDVRITTEERDNHVKANTLEKLIVDRAGVVFANHESQENVDTFRVVSISDLEVLKYLTPPEGEIELVVRLGINNNDTKLATAFIETKVVVVSKKDEKEDKKKKKKKKKDKGDSPAGKKGGSGGEDIEDEGDDGGDDAAEKRKEQERKAKEKARKEMLDKATAKISAKEREKEENIAVSAQEEKEKNDGPSPLGVGLLAIAMALAVFFGWWIRQDLKVINWFKQKKNLRMKR